MKTIFFLTPFLCAVLATSGQSRQDILGKWKIIALNAGVYHNYKNDSTSVPVEIQEGLKGNKDSLMTIALITGMVKEFDNYHYIFMEDGQFQEKKGDKLQQQGTYTNDLKNQQIILIVKHKYSGENRQTLQYKIKAGRLELRIPSDETDIVFELEKVE
jgi:hypothetical protein